MDFPQDGGLSSVRYFLEDDGSVLVQEARRQVASPTTVAGRLRCQCGAAELCWAIRSHESWTRLDCTCNGSSLPVYVGPPPGGRATPGAEVRCPRCSKSAFSVAVSVGYGDAPLPQLGTMEAECAKEVVVFCLCGCGERFTGWSLRLPSPFKARGDEPWLKRVQGLGFSQRKR